MCGYNPPTEIISSSNELLIKFHTDADGSDSGYPAPKVTWTFKSCESYEECNGETVHLTATKESAG